MSQVRESPNTVFEFVLDTFERKCDLSTTSLVSTCRFREISDARMAFYKILRGMFGLSYSTIGSLFMKNHSTVVSAVKRHEELYTRDKCYTKLYDSIRDDVTLRLKLQHLYAMKNGVVKLKTLHINEHESCDVILKCFGSRMASSSYLLDKDVAKEHVVFHGQPDVISRLIANEVVSSDEKRYMLDVMRHNTDPLLSLLNNKVDRYYLNYGNNLFDILNDPEASLRTAISLFPESDVALIHLRSAL